MVSNFGGLIQSVGAAWMMISLAQFRRQWLRWCRHRSTLPIMLLSLWAGAMADNLDRRRVMLGAQSLMLASPWRSSVCAWTGMITPWLLLRFTFLIGCGTAFNAPAWQASVGDMVPRAELPGAVALNSMGFNIARSVGPAIGGAIVAAAGAAAAFRDQCAELHRADLRAARWRPPRRRVCCRARRSARDGRGRALRGDVAGHSHRDVSQRAVRHRRQRGAGADAAGRERPDWRRAADLRHAARRIRSRARSRARSAIHASAPRVYRPKSIVRWSQRRLSPSPRRSPGSSTISARDDAGADARRRRLGADAVDLQRHRADVVAALGRRARPVAVSDGRFRRAGRR